MKLLARLKRNLFPEVNINRQLRAAEKQVKINGIYFFERSLLMIKYTVFVLLAAVACSV